MPRTNMPLFQDLTWSSFLASSCVFLICGFVCKIIYTLYLSPLAHIPGPKLAAIHPMFGFRLSEMPFEALQAIHSEYGPTVRVGPNEVSVMSAKAIPKIYGAEAGLQKAPLYDMFSSPGVNGPMFAMRDEAVHKPRRRLLNPAYSRSSMLVLRPWVFDQCKMLCDHMARAASSGEGVDVIKYFRMLTGDTALKMAFNIDGDMVKDVSIHTVMNYIQLEMSTPFYIRRFARRLIPYTPSWILEHLPTQFKARLFALSDVEKLSQTYLQEYIRQLKQGTADNREVMSWIIDAVNPATGEKLSLAELTAEARSLILAGSDTTAITLSYIAWLISRSPSVRSRLQTELATVMPDPTTLPGDLSTLENLPYLSACIHETMRLYPAIPGPFPRVVSERGLEVGRYALPPGTIVGVNALVSHRSQPEIWGDYPETYRPERWLDPTADISTMRKSLLTFGTGPRSCIGRNVAILQLYAMTAAFFARFDGEVISPEENMRPSGTFNLSLQAGGCLINLTKASSN